MSVFFRASVWARLTSNEIEALKLRLILPIFPGNDFVFLKPPWKYAANSGSDTLVSL
jgi:hypothetical protein